MNYLQLIYQWFNALPKKRKVSLSLSVLFILSLTTVLGWWVLSPSYAVLFKHLDEQDSAKILNQLEQSNIDYQLRDGGTEILIAKNLIPQTRLKIMSSGVQLTGSIGFELFDKSDFGMTDFSQKINYQRALQGELERTIASLDEISQARVHLVLPENHLFDKTDNQPKAAVTLHLKHKITPQQVQSIQQLLTASIAHLTVKNVVIVDQNGNTLSQSEEDNSFSQLRTKKTIEHYLNDKVTQLLHKIFTRNQVMVKIDAAINYDELQRELVKPQTQGLITHEKEIKHSTSGKTDKDKNNQEVTLEKSYQLGSEKELFKKASGTIERLTISVLVPQNTEEQTLAQVRRLVKNAVGFDERRGDIISIEALIVRPNPSSNREPMVTPPVSLQDENNQLILYLLIMALFISFSAAVMLKKARNKKRRLLLIELTQWLNHHE